MTFTKTSQKFGQWADSRANTVYGLGFASEQQLTQVGRDMSSGWHLCSLWWVHREQDPLSALGSMVICPLGSNITHSLCLLEHQLEACTGTSSSLFSLYHHHLVLTPLFVLHLFLSVCVCVHVPCVC